MVSAGEGTLSHAMRFRALRTSQTWRRVNRRGGGTDGGWGATQPLCITYTATQILTLFKQKTPYSLKLVVAETRL